MPVLTRKPGALRNGAPFKGWKLPDALGRLRTRLAGHDDGDRQFVKVLAAVLEDGLEAVEAACAEALDCGACSADVVLNILARQRQPAPPADIPTPEGLQLRHQPVADCRRYDSLREDGRPGWRAHKRATERHDVLEMMTALKLAGMRAAYDDILATCTPRGAQAPSPGAADHRRVAAGRDRRQAGTLDQVPDGVRQAADGLRRWPTSTSPPRRSTSP